MDHFSLCLLQDMKNGKFEEGEVRQCITYVSVFVGEGMGWRGPVIQKLFAYYIIVIQECFEH